MRTNIFFVGVVLLSMASIGFANMSLQERIDRAAGNNRYETKKASMTGGNFLSATPAVLGYEIKEVAEQNTFVNSGMAAGGCHGLMKRSAGSCSGYAAACHGRRGLFQRAADRRDSRQATRQHRRSARQTARGCH